MPEYGTASKIADELFNRELSGKLSDHLLMRIIAEQEMGYVDYQDSDPKNPLKSATHHQTMERDRILKQQIRKLIRLGVPERTQTSINDLLLLPPDVYEIVVREVEEYNEDEAERNAELATTIENSIEKLEEEKAKK